MFQQELMLLTHDWETTHDQILVFLLNEVSTLKSTASHRLFLSFSYVKATKNAQCF